MWVDKTLDGCKHGPMLEKDDGEGSIWEFAQLMKLAHGVLRGLEIEQLKDVGFIGGGASTTTLCGKVTVKTVSLSYGAERYFHFVGVHGRINQDDALALVDVLASILDVPAHTQFRRAPDRGTLVIRCDAGSEHVLQDRIALLRDEDALADALVTVLRQH